MATLEELRNRSGSLFTELLRAQATEQPDAYSWFDRDDATAAGALAFRLAALAASGTTVEEGLTAAIDDAEARRATTRPPELQIALALFVTHTRTGRRLSKPRTVAAAPALFTPPRAGGVAPAISIGGPSPGLDYWREDVLANEHHQHWHEVYPFTGLPPASFEDWMAGHSEAEFVEILEALAPDQDWAALLPTLTPAQLASIFAQVLDPRVAGALPRGLYAKLFRLNDRQGELFFYMHEQMLARYDAELLSHGLARVTPWDPDDWDDPIDVGHDPIEIEGFGRREQNRTLGAQERAALQGRWEELDEALDDGALLALAGGTVPIDRENLGEAVESTAPQLRALAEDAYDNLHGAGHVFLSQLAAPVLGVMSNPVAAIRDPIFWRWHKAIDDLSARWQDTLDPYTFEDAPPVLVRDGDGRWASPDIILCRTADLPEGEDPGELGPRLFGGERWDAVDATELETVSELTTTMREVTFGGERIRFLTHEPFSYFLRIENTAGAARTVTVRIFLAPADAASDRRMWIEMDKFLAELQPGRQVLYRPDTESSVIKRPAETSPAAVTPAGADPDERSYCDCGWPYTLLLPRGDAAGMAFRLLVLCTDAAIDQVDPPEHCGSMSFCGAVDRYPDARDMGYPFSRPFAGPPETAITDWVLALDTAAARSLTIRHV